MTEFYAQPYSIEHTGFYFDSVETFKTGMERLKKKGCEEVEIQFIESDDHLATLAKYADASQSDIDFWFENLEDLEPENVIRLCYLLDQGLDIESALEHTDAVCLYHGTAEDYAQEIIEETTDIPENLRAYIDYNAIARDMKLSGEIVEIEHALIVTNALEF